MIHPQVLHEAHGSLQELRRLGLLGQPNLSEEALTEEGQDPENIPTWEPGTVVFQNLYRVEQIVFA